MRIVPVHKARAELAKLLRAVEAGENVTISRDGKPVAQLTPIPETGAAAERVELVLAEFRALRRKAAGKSPSGRDIKSWISEGRR